MRFRNADAVSPERAGHGSRAKHELTSILAAYRERLVDGQAREAKVKTARAVFVEVFVRVKAEIIGPVLEEFVVQLNEAGHQASVVDQKEGVRSQRAVQSGQHDPSDGAGPVRGHGARCRRGAPESR